MGVRRAVEMVLDAPRKYEKPICTYGPLIHNPQVLNSLAEKGITVIDEIPESACGTVLIRAHGVPPETKARLTHAGYDVIDATCPRVIKVQSIIKTHSARGYAVIIIGDRDHPEVVGLLGFAANRGHVVGSMDALEALPAFDQAIIVAQTTQNMAFFEAVQSWAQKRYPHYRVFDTICDSTTRRQSEVKRLAECAEAVIVVGGKSSGNTQRLAEIAQKTGKPTFHIETEDELAPAQLANAQSIAITAGASTPNWIIKRVYRALETLPFQRGSQLRKFLYASQRFLLLTNIYVSLGAGCLCYACVRLLGIPNPLPHVIIAMLYVQSMHILNHLTGSKADHYNDPKRGSFYRKHRLSLSALALVAGAAGLLIASAMGWIPFAILLVMSVLGLSYNLRLLPKGVAAGRYRRIRDIPSSKTILIAVAWGVVTALLPPLSALHQMKLSTIAVFAVSTGMVFVRTAFFDILDMQGDRLVGRETIPIILGEKRAMTLLRGMLIGIVVLLLVATVFNWLSSLGFLLVLCPLFMALTFSAYRFGSVLPGTLLEFLVETHFIIAGGLTFLWSLL